METTESLSVKDWLEDNTQSTVISGSLSKWKNISL